MFCGFGRQMGCGCSGPKVSCGRGGPQVGCGGFVPIWVLLVTRWVVGVLSLGGL